MSEHEQETGNGEELIDEEGRNRTQRQIEGDEPGPREHRRGVER